ncbi:MAG TPA: hypothetical protein VGG92_19535, partial [Caulobacteraceae bacterium]
MLESDLEANALLKSMEPPLKLRFAPRLQRVQLQKGQTIHNQGQPVERVLFPLKGLIAIMSETLAGESVQ